MNRYLVNDIKVKVTVEKDDTMKPIYSIEDLYGIWKDKMIISGDFDEPLEKFKEYTV